MHRGGTVKRTLSFVTFPPASTSTDAPESIIELFFENCLICSCRSMVHTKMAVQQQVQ